MGKNTVNRVRAIREAMEIKSVAEFARRLDVPYMTVKNWEDRNSIPKIEWAKIFEEKIPNFNAEFFRDETAPIFRNTTQTGNKSSDDTKAALTHIPVRNYPIYAAVSAGTPIGMWEFENKPDNEIFISHPRLNKIRDKVYGFLVTGDSMKERFRANDTVFCTYLDINNGQYPHDLDFVAAFFNSDPETTEASIKLFQWNDKSKTSFILKSVNPYFSDRHCTFKDIRKMFRVRMSLSFPDYRDNKSS